MLRGILFWSLFLSVKGYPNGWIKSGECLDLNEGPLMEDVVPQINQNIISVEDSTNLDDCAHKCLRNSECGYFTFYNLPMGAKGDCELVGYNLEEPCFTLQYKCVLLQTCYRFSPHCFSCFTGIRPFNYPVDESVLIFNGDVDEPNYLQLQVEQSSSEITNNIELIAKGETCIIWSERLESRIGSFGVYTGENALNCGGYSMENSSYLKDCDVFQENGTLSKTGSLLQARGYASGVSILGRVFVVGGYNDQNGYLGSMEEYVDGNWTGVPLLALSMNRSHFCIAAMKKKYILVVGGWNGVKYLRGVERLRFSKNGAIKGGWDAFTRGMMEPRSDAACIESQYGWDYGLLVAGGYDSDSAWKDSVEFLNYETEKWTPLKRLPNLWTGRHYHGIAHLNSLPTVFGGWSNGAIDSFESLSVKNINDLSSINWHPLMDIRLTYRREKFAYVRIPTLNSSLSC